MDPALFMNCPRFPPATELMAIVDTFVPIRQRDRCHRDTIESCKPLPRLIQLVHRECPGYREQFAQLLECEARLEAMLEAPLNRLRWVSLVCSKEGTDRARLMQEFLDKESTLHRFLHPRSEVIELIQPTEQLPLLLFESGSFEDLQAAQKELQNYTAMISGQLQRLRSTDYGQIRQDLVEILNAVEQSEENGLTVDWQELDRRADLLKSRVDRLDQHDEVKKAQMMARFPIEREGIATPTWRNQHAAALMRWQQLGLIFQDVQAAAKSAGYEWEIHSDLLVKMLLRALPIQSYIQRDRLEALLASSWKPILSEMPNGWRRTMDAFCDNLFLLRTKTLKI